MQFIPIKTRKFLPPKDDIFKLLDETPRLKNGDVLFITSKILSIHQGRCVKIDGQDKDRLILKEAERFVPKLKGAPHPFILTIKDYVIIPSAGIDESNANGYYILWPKNIQKSVKEIWQYLKKKHKLSKLGVVVTDSHTVPLRWGTQGVSIGFYGFEPLFDYRGKKDIFGRKLKYTQKNIADALSAIAVMLMGEGNEQTPLLILRGAEFVKFTNKNLYRKLVVPPENDLYYPLLKPFRKQ